MEINTEKREKFGKKTKKIRESLKVPAVIYAKGINSIPITIGKNQFLKVYSKAGETTLVDLKINGKTEKVLIAEVQTHPVTSEVIHVSFHKVDLKEKITAEVPVEVIGEKESPVLKSGEGMLLVLLSEIEVEALPTDLPSKFVVDVSHLTQINQAVAVGELQYDRKKVEIVDLELDDLVVKIDYAEMAEEEEAVVTEAELVEKVEATEELSEEELAKREEEEKAKGEEKKVEEKPKE